MESISFATSLKQCDYDSLQQLIEQYKNDMKSLVQDAINQFTASSQDLDDIKQIVASINSKLTEDTVDRLNNLGTPDDFKLGFYSVFTGDSNG